MDTTTKGWHLPQTHAVPIKVVKKEVDPSLDATIQKMLMKKEKKNERKKRRRKKKPGAELNIHT